MNFCKDGGYLVDGRRLFPDDPNDYYTGGQPITGCNRLRCPQCKAVVRSVAGYTIPEKTKPDLTQLYEVQDLATSPALKKDPPFREYLCRCNSWTETSYRALHDPDPGFDSPRLPWHCEGHAVVALPHDFDGTVVTNEEELAALVNATLAGTLPPKARKEDGPATWWLIRLHDRLASSPYTQKVVSTVEAALDHSDSKVRGRALRFFFSVESRSARERTLDLYDRNRSLFAGVPDEVTDVDKDKTLEDSVWRVIGPLVGAPGRARDLARAEAVAPGRGRNSLYSAIAHEDAEWVAAHIEEIFRATPALHKDLLLLVRARFPPNVPSKPTADKLRALIAATGGPN